MIASFLRSTEISNVFSFSLNMCRRQALERSWAVAFRDHVLPQFPVDALATCFARPRRGRPRKDFRLILGVLLLPQLHDGTDAVTVETVPLISLGLMPLPSRRGQISISVSGRYVTTAGL